MQKAQRAFSAQQTYPHNLVAKTGIGRTTEDYRTNQNVFLQGEVADSVFFIQTGRVKLTVTSEQGKEAVVGILNEGQFFGEGCLQSHSVRGATAIALDDCRITSITRAAMQAGIREQPRFSNLFMEHLLSRNSRIQEDVIDQLSIQARSGLPACYSFSRIMGKKETLLSFPSLSAKRRLRK